MPTMVKDRELLKQFDLVSEDQVAALLGITVESLRNRPVDKLPAFFKSGRRRLFRGEAVRAFIDRHTRSAA